MAINKFPNQIFVDGDYTIWDSIKEAAVGGVTGKVGVYKLIKTAKFEITLVEDK